MEAERVGDRDDAEHARASPTTRSRCAWPVTRGKSTGNGRTTERSPRVSGSQPLDEPVVRELVARTAAGPRRPSRDRSAVAAQLVDRDAAPRCDVAGRRRTRSRRRPPPRARRRCGPRPRARRTRRPRGTRCRSPRPRARPTGRGTTSRTRRRSRRAPARSSSDTRPRKCTSGRSRGAPFEPRAVAAAPAIASCTPSSRGDRVDQHVEALPRAPSRVRPSTSGRSGSSPNRARVAARCSSSAGGSARRRRRADDQTPAAPAPRPARPPRPGIRPPRRPPPRRAARAGRAGACRAAGRRHVISAPCTTTT